MSEFLARYGDPETVKKIIDSDPHGMNFEVTNAVAKNPTIDAKTLLKIHTTASSANARHMAASHKNFPAEMLDVIDHNQYKQAIATNPNTAGHTLEKVHKRLELETNTMGKQYSLVRQLIAQHPNLPKHMQEKFLSMPSSTPERQYILTNNHINPDVVQKHYDKIDHINYDNQQDSDIRDLIKNPATPAKVITHMVSMLHGEALAHPNLPDEIKHQVLATGRPIDRFMLSSNPKLTKHEFDQIAYKADNEQNDNDVKYYTHKGLLRHYPNNNYDSRKNSYKPY